MSSSAAFYSERLGVKRLLIPRSFHALVVLWLVALARGESSTYSSCSVVIDGSGGIAATRSSARRSNLEAGIYALVECGKDTLHNDTTPVAGIKPIVIKGTPMTLFAPVGDNKYAVLSIQGYAGDDPFELINSTFTNLPILEGSTRAPLVISGSKVKLTGGRFEGNTAGFESGGVFLQKAVSGAVGNEKNEESAAGSVQISGMTFSANKGTLAGAVAIQDHPGLTMKHCKLSSNDASAIRVLGSEKVTLVVEGSTFEGAVWGSKPKYTSISGESPGSVTIKGSTFARHDFKKGGALNWANKANDEIVHLDLDDCTFEENKSEDSGGAVSAGKSVALSITKSNFTNNVASMYGGAIELAGHHSAHMSHTIFVKNVGDFEGGAINMRNVKPSAPGGKYELHLEGVHFIGNESPSGPGGAMVVKAGNITMSGGSMEGNKASDTGGAVFIQAAELVKFNGVIFEANSVSEEMGESGGAIYAKGVKEVNIDDCGFTGNEAGANDCMDLPEEVGGGALFVEGTQATTTVSVKGSHFTKNVGKMGGAVFLSNLASAAIVNSIFKGNIAYQAGSIKVDSVTDFDIQLTTVQESEACGWYGGGVFAREGSRFSMSGSTFTDNESLEDDGGGAKVETYETILVSKSTFKGNTAKGSGGAFHIAEATRLDVTDTTFSTNAGKLGGSLFTTSVSQVELAGSAFSQSTATTKGGAYYATGNTDAVTISGTTFTESKVKAGVAPTDGGGGVALDDVPTVKISKSKFRGNHATRGGGALLSSCSEVTLSGCEVHGNTAEVEGGGVWSTASTSFSATGTNFTSNAATTGVGGAVYAFGEKSTSMNAYKRRRSIGFSGSSFHKNRGSKGGGAFVSGFSSSIFSKSRFSHNTARSRGGGLHVEDTHSVNIGGSSSFTSSSASASGGAVSVVGSSTVSVEGSTFISNKSKTGGAVHLEGVGKFTGSKLSVSDNRASQEGGGFYTHRSRSFLLIDSSFQRNNAMNGGGLWCDGSRSYGFRGAGSIWASNAEGEDMIIRMKDTNFTDNKATVDGGAVLVENVEEVDFVNSMLEGNTAKQGAGIFADAVHTMAVEDVTIADAIAEENGGAVYLEAVSNITAKSMNFVKNRADEEGGGMFCGNGTHATFSHSKFVLNRAADMGATVMADCGCEVDISTSVLELEMQSNGSENDTRDNAFYNHPGCALAAAIQLRNCTERFVALDSGIGITAILIIVVFGVLVLLLGVMLWMVILAKDPLRKEEDAHEAQLMAVAAVGVPKMPASMAAQSKTDAQTPLLP